MSDFLGCLFLSVKEGDRKMIQGKIYDSEEYHRLHIDGLGKLLMPACRC